MTNSKLVRSLEQIARQVPTARSVGEAVVLTETVTALCGSRSQSHQARYRIGRLLLEHHAPHIIAPVCPDYTVVDGRYTFRGLGSGIPLLGNRHIEFLLRLAPLIPSCSVTFLIADHEADDETLCRVMKLSQEEFRARIEASCIAIQERVAAHGWQALCMTRAMPELVSEESRHTKAIRADSTLRARVVSDALARASMYRRIDPGLTQAVMEMRTVRTAAQYRALGTLATDRGWLVCNHTTTNLAFYADVGVALLHNPIEVY